MGQIAKCKHCGEPIEQKKKYGFFGGEYDVWEHLRTKTETCRKCTSCGYVGPYEGSFACPKCGSLFWAYASDNYAKPSI